MFECKNKGQTVDVYKTLVKFDTIAGSRASLDFHWSLKLAPATNRLFSTQTIKNILAYKFSNARGMAWIHFGCYSAYIAFLSLRDTTLLTPWTIIMVCFELTKFYEAFKVGDCVSYFRPIQN
jgi:hypothetical protein